jgi:hypothetical protein
MRLLRVKLAPLTRSYDLGGVGHRCWPVEALPEGILDQRSWCRVVAACPRVDFPKQLPPFLGRNAMLQDSRGAAFVQLPV